MCVLIRLLISSIQGSMSTLYLTWLQLLFRFIEDIFTYIFFTSVQKTNAVHFAWIVQPFLTFEWAEPWW